MARNHLADCVAWQFIEEHGLARNGESAEALLDVCANLLIGQGAALRGVVADNPGDQGLTEALIRDTCDCALADTLELAECIFGLAWEDVLATGDNHVVLATGDVEQAVFHATQVTGTDHAVNDLLVRARAGVALVQHVVADEDSTGLAVGDAVAVFVENLDTSAQRCATSCGWVCLELIRVSNGCPADLRGTVLVVENRPEALEGLGDNSLWNSRTAGCDDL